MRLLVILHRWLGLSTAVFLFISGLTGAVISWDHELDEWINPEFFHVKSSEGPQPALLSAMELANRVERDHPEFRVTYLPLAVEPGHVLQMSITPRIDPKTGKQFPLEYNQIAVNPGTGEIQAKRFWGAVSLKRENVMPFLYRLHYSLHLPQAFGIETGILFMGIVGLAWIVDCFVSIVIAFPNRRMWRRSFAFRWRQGGARLNFDLHRSGGVWVWLLLLVLAVTSASMNLRAQVVVPIISLFSKLTPNPFDTRKPTTDDEPIVPRFDRETVVEKSRQEAARRGWEAPGGVFYAPNFGAYGVGLFAAGNDHGDGGLGNPWLYFDGVTGESAGEIVPGTGTAGDIFLQAQFPLHSGRIVGLPGRIFVSLLGLVVAMLSVTGVILWARRRVRRQRREVPTPAVMARAA